MKKKNLRWSSFANLFEKNSKNYKLSKENEYYHLKRLKYLDLIYFNTNIIK